MADNFVVIRATDTDGRQIFVRQISTGKCFAMVMPGGHTAESRKESVLREAKLLAQQLLHPHIIRLHDCFFNGSNRLCLVVEITSGGTLEQKISEQRDKQGHFDEAELMQLNVQLLMAVDFIHSRRILHRNIKPSSVYFSCLNTVKLGDFQLAVGDNREKPHYAHPDLSYTAQTDMWALGCLLQETATLKRPFGSCDYLEKFSSLAFKVPMPIGYSCELRKVIKSLLTLCPASRPTAKDLLSSTFVRHHLDKLIEERETIRVLYNERKTMLNLSPCIFRSKKHFVPYHLTLSPTGYDHRGSCDVLAITPDVVSSRRASLLSNEELLKAPNSQNDCRRPKSSLGLVRTAPDPSDYLMSPHTRTRLLSPEPFSSDRMGRSFGSDTAFSDNQFHSDDRLSEGDFLNHNDFTPDSELREIPYIYTDDTEDLADESDHEWDSVIKNARGCRFAVSQLKPLRKQLSEAKENCCPTVPKTKTWSI